MSRTKKTRGREIIRLPYLKLKPTEEASLIMYKGERGVGPRDTSDESKWTKPNSFGNYVNKFTCAFEEEPETFYMWESTTPSSYALLDAVDEEPLEYPFTIELVRQDERSFKIFLKE